MPYILLQGLGFYQGKYSFKIAKSQLPAISVFNVDEIGLTVIESSVVFILKAKREFVAQTLIYIISFSGNFSLV
jgi:hypothetical protein